MRRSSRQNERSAAQRTAVGYVRRSTDRQEQSIPDQIKVIERYAQDQGLTILRYYTDDAISGTSVQGRRAFQELIADAQAPGCPFRFVVVYDVKRFGRVDNDEAGYYRHLLKTAPGGGVEVMYATEGFLGAETDDLLRPVKQWQARQESKDLSKVTIRGLLSRSEGGWWMGGVAPHGYDLRYENDKGEFIFVLRHMPDGTKQMLDDRGTLVRTLARGESLSISKRDRAKLVPGDPDRVMAVKRIFELYVNERRGLKAVTDSLNKDGIPTPRGAAWSEAYSGSWTQGSVRSILVNPIYAGDMVWNRRTDARFHKITMTERGGAAVERKQHHGARLVPNDESDWIIVRDTHVGLVSRKVFEQARQIRTAKPVSASQEGLARVAGSDGRSVGGWSGARSRFVLSGLVKCAVCGCRYQGVTRQKGAKERDGSRIKTFSYACGGYIAKGKSACQFNPVGQAVLETLVCDAVLGYYQQYAGPEGRVLLEVAVQASLGIESEDLKDARKRLDADRKRVEATIANLLDSITPTIREDVERRLGQLRAERKVLESRDVELDLLQAGQAKVKEVVHEQAKFLAGLEFTLRHGLPEERKVALRRCVAEVVVDKAAGTAGVSLRELPGADDGTLASVTLSL